MPKRPLPFVLLLAMPLVHAQQVPLTIGDATIQFPVDSDYVRVSETRPKLFAIEQAETPPANRLVETLVTRSDLQRLEQGHYAADFFYEVQTLRETEPLKISMDDWNALKPQLVGSMTRIDVGQGFSSDNGVNGRVSAVAGRQVTISYGKISTPSIYRATPLSLNFMAVVPVQMRVGSDLKSATVAIAGAFTVVRNKLIYIDGFSMDASAGSFASLRSHVNDLVDQTIALNPSDMAVRSTGTFDWSQVGKYALIGGIIGLLLWIFKRRQE